MGAKNHNGLCSQQSLRHLCYATHPPGGQRPFTRMPPHPPRPHPRGKPAKAAGPAWPAHGRELGAAPEQALRNISREIICESLLRDRAKSARLEVPSLRRPLQAILPAREVGAARIGIVRSLNPCNEGPF